jgi:hypothetical protein
MNAWRDLAGFLIAVIVGFVAVTFAQGIAGGMCTAETQILEDPVGALLSRPFDLDPACEDWPTMFETWLTVWLPICAALFLTGVLTAKLSTRVSPARCAVAGAIPYSSILVVYLLISHDAFRYNLAAGNQPPPFDLSLAIIVIVVAAAAGALLGFAGGIFMKRSLRQSHGDGLTEHPERLDEMLDPTDDA